MALAVYVIVAACIKQHTGLAGAIRFEVDDVEYWVARYANVDRQGHVASSSLVIYPDSGPTVSGSTQFDSFRGTTIVSLKIGGRVVTAKTNTLYFIRKDTIEFEMEYRDLGIDASQLNTDLEGMLVYLQPILEKTIRENVK